MSLEVVRALGLVTLQDRGRPGYMHAALARGGALVPSLLARANRRVGNRDDALGVEVCGQLVVRATARIAVATVDEARVLLAGEQLVIESEPARVTYLALRGGIAAPLVLGGRGAHLSAGLGSLARTGDRFASALEPHAASAVPLPALSAIRVLPGPDLPSFAPDAFDAFLAATYRIAASSDRIGTRLEGPTIARTAVPDVTRPLTLGAIEVPADGVPIVLGPEHPTTGGYPVLAVVASDACDALFAIRPGGDVRFSR